MAKIEKKLKLILIAHNAGAVRLSRSLTNQQLCQSKRKQIILLFLKKLFSYFKVLFQEKLHSILNRSAIFREKTNLKSKASTIYAKGVDSYI